MSENIGVIRISFRDSSCGRFVHCYVSQWEAMSDGKVEENIIGQGCGMLRWNDATDYREAREIALWAAVTDTRLERARWKARMRREALQGAPWNQ